MLIQLSGTLVNTTISVNVSTTPQVLLLIKAVKIYTTYSCNIAVNITGTTYISVI